MLLNWKGHGPWGIGHPAPPGQEKGRVLSQVTVCVPGVNHLKDDFWGLVKSHPQIQKFVKDKVVEILTEKDGTAEGAKAKVGVAPALAPLSDDEAEAAVRQCLVKELLESWLAADNRPRIQFAAREQLDVLKLPSKKKED